jgi:hypothetical protein
LRACNTNAAAGALIPDAAARNSARCLSRSMQVVRAAACSLRQTAACGRARDVPRGLSVRPWLTCVRGNRDGACARACSVDRSASRFKSPPLALWERRTRSSKRLQAPFIRARTRFRAAYTGGTRTRQCDCCASAATSKTLTRQ